MKKLIILIMATFLFSACTSLTHQERNTLYSLKAHGITIDKPVGNWEPPASAGVAGVLNILPGIGNFYLAMGNAGDNDQYVYGFLNLLFWPISVVWGIPEAGIDANTINKRELIYFYTFNKAGKSALGKKGLEITPAGELKEIK